MGSTTTGATTGAGVATGAGARWDVQAVPSHQRSCPDPGEVGCGLVSVPGSTASFTMGPSPYPNSQINVVSHPSIASIIGVLLSSTYNPNLVSDESGRGFSTAEVRAMANLPDFMQAAVSAPNGSAIIGGGEDSMLRVWDGAGKELAVFGAK